MTLTPFQLNVAMSLIGIAIPTLVYVGCIMTAKKKPTPVQHEAAPHFELDRAA